MKPLDGQTAIVTGAGRGIGRAVAAAFAEAGANVVVAARSADEIAATASAIGERCRAVAGDVTREASVRDIVSAAQDAFGGCDILINAAGIQPAPASLEDTSPQDWARTFDVNVTGTYLMCRAVLPAMKSQRKGQIVNVSSGLAVRVVPGSAAYGAAKAAVVQLSAILAAEAADHGILVNAVHPGIVDTQLVRDLVASAPDAPLSVRLDGLRRDGKLVEAEDSARFFLWLVVAGGRTGEFVHIDDETVQVEMAAWQERRAGG